MPVNQYIITEEQLSDLEKRGSGSKDCIGGFREDIAKEIRSHPYQSERDIDEWCKVHSEVIKDIQTSAYREGYHDGEVVGAKGEREKVLEKFWISIISDRELPKIIPNYYSVVLDRILKIKEELRQQAGEPE
jgi:hypothetical protein